MRILTFSILPFLALTLGAQPQADHAPTRAALARAMKVIPVADLVAAMPLPHALPLGSLIDMNLHDDSNGAGVLGGDEDRVYRVMELTDLVRSMTPLAWDDGNASVDLVGNSLILTGAPDQIHLIEQAVQQVVAVLGEAARVRAAVFAADRMEPTAVAAESYADAFARYTKLCGRPLWDGNASAYPNQIIELGVHRVTPYIADCDVEIAQSSSLANPIVVGMHEGTRLQVELHALAGSSDLVLFCHYALGEKLAMHPVSLGPDRALPTLQSPEMATTLGSVSGRIANGGCLVVQLTGTLEGRSLVLLLGAERTPVAPAQQREAGIWPISAFLSTALRRQVVPPVSDDPDLDRLSSPSVSVHEDPLPAVEPAEAELWHDLLTRALGDGDVEVSVLENGLVTVRGDATAREVAARLIETYQDQFLKTVDVELRTSGDGAATALRSVVTPALLGRSQYLVHGIETTTVTDADVEVAQKAGISDPKVRRQFSGIVAQVQVYPGRTRDLGARAWIEVVQTAAPTSFAMGTEKGVTLQQSTVSRATFRHSGLMPAGALDLGETGELVVGRERVRARQGLAVRMR